MKLSTIGYFTLAASYLAACADSSPPVYYAALPPPPPVRAVVRIYAPPPPLPVYDQPPLPEPGYIWTPGYWAWSASAGDYYWVPGAWVLAPEPGLLWTPAWWGWSSGAYVFHGGYWGAHVGFYGGINYGFGYGGLGYQGGYWNGRSFFYNRTVNRITNVNVTNIYNQTVVNRTTVNNISYNGGGGVVAQPTAQERAFGSEQHMAATPAQAQHLQAAKATPALFAAANHGAPPIAATARAGQFQGPGVVAARGAFAPRPAASGNAIGAQAPRPAAPRGAVYGGVAPVTHTLGAYDDRRDVAVHSATAPAGSGQGFRASDSRAFGGGEVTEARSPGAFASPAAPAYAGAAHEGARADDGREYGAGASPSRLSTPSRTAGAAAFRPPPPRPSRPPPSRPASRRPHPDPHPQESREH